LIATALVLWPGGAPPVRDTEVFVLGALGALHEREPGFTFETLSLVVQRIDPEVILLEVTPDELAGRLATKGRPEYPRVVWPLLEQPDPPKVYPMEAGQPLYDEMARTAEPVWSAFARDRAEDNAALTAYTEAATNALLAYWRSPSDTQDDATDALARARYQLRAALLPAGHVVQLRWDSVMVDAAAKAIAAHPGARVLVVGSFRNRFMFVEALRPLPGVRIVNMHGWLRDNGFGREPAG
jgi:hypothetical protein